MIIARRRWIIMSNDKQEVLCGKKGNYQMYGVGKVGKHNVLYYMSKKKAEQAIKNSWWLEGSDLIPVEVVETIMTVEAS